MVPLLAIDKAVAVPIPDTQVEIEVDDQLAESLVDMLNGTNRKFVVAAAEMLESAMAGGVVGTLCEVIEYGEEIDPVADSCIRTLTFKCISRVIVRPFEAASMVPQVTYSKIYEEIIPTETEHFARFEESISLLIKGGKAFGALTVKSLEEASGFAIKRLNIVANAVLTDPNDRIDYLMKLSHSARIELLFDKALIKELKSIRPHKRRFTARRLTKQEDSGEVESPSEQTAKKILALPIPSETMEQLERDLSKLKKLQPSSTEYHQLTDYFDWVASLPWGVEFKKEIDFSSLIALMDETHYGLPDVKEMILEYMVVESLTSRGVGSSMCFVGPPGTGKTSIARSVAKACNRPFIRISLGGVTDEAEIRGHRRTYVAARPGRIVTGIKTAKAMDPLILLDEVDKIPNLVRSGAVSSALLELLDPEQNHEFVDRYLEFPIDLSRVMFICTANEEKDIPAPLRDRMEIVSFRNYTREERLVILRDYVIPNSVKKYCLDSGSISFSESVIDKLADIEQVRKLDQIVKRLLRMAAVEIAVHGSESVSIGDSHYGRATEGAGSSRGKANTRLGF